MADTPTVPSANDWALEAASSGDWRRLAAWGRFTLAAQTLRLSDARNAETYLPSLVELQAVERHVQRKEFALALARLEALQEAPADLIEPQTALKDMQTLVAASEAIDRRDFEGASERLQALSNDFFAAERDTLLGTMAVLSSDSAEALARFDAALVRDPYHLRALTNRGNLKLEAGDVDGAIADYEAALRVDDGFANAHHNLGVAYRRKGQISKSVAALRRAQRSSLRQDADSVRSARKTKRQGNPRNRRWWWWAALAAVAWWFARQQGLI